MRVFLNYRTEIVFLLHGTEFRTTLSISSAVLQSCIVLSVQLASLSQFFISLQLFFYMGIKVVQRELVHDATT